MGMTINIGRVGILMFTLVVLVDLVWKALIVI